MTLRERIVSAAIAAVGMGAHDPEPFEELVGPGEREPVQDALTHASTCGLVVAGIWRRAGIVHPSLAAPYRIGSAISRLLEIAHERGAWVPARPGLRPKAGDMVGLALFGPDAGTSGHVYTVVDASDPAHPVSVDGGQIDAQGRQLVSQKVRTWSEGAGMISDGAPGSRVRKVEGWIDADRLEGLARGYPLEQHEYVSYVPAAAHAGGKAIAELEHVEGIDVSSDNGDIQWARVPSEIRFVCVRAQLGVDQRDTHLQQNANGARSTGRELALYGLCLPGIWNGRERVFGGASDAERQARQLAACHREAGATLRPWVDVEPTKAMLAARVSGRAWALCARIYLETLEAEGLPPMVYTNGGWWDSVPELRDEVFARWPLAGSDYRGLELPFTPRPWKKTTIYQYAAGDPAGVVGHVEGVPTVVDRDRILEGGLGALRL